MAFNDEIQEIRGFANRMKSVFKNHKLEMIASAGVGFVACAFLGFAF